MNLSKLSVRRPVLTSMVILIAVSFGILSIFNLGMDMMPNMNIPIAIVRTVYEGTGSEEMETLVTKPIEQVMGTVSGMKSVSSQTSYETSLVIVEFEESVNLDNAALDMREKVDMISRLLPEGAEKPVVMKIDINAMTSLNIGITSEKMDLVDLKQLAENKMEDRLARQDGVASVTINGGRKKEIEVIVEQDKMRGYGITETTLAQTLRAENKSVPTGSIKQGEQRLTMRVSGEFATLEEIRNLPIMMPTGATVFVRDVAVVKEVFQEADSVSYINGVPSITISIQKQSTANTVKVSDNVKAELAKMQKELPDLSVKILEDPADYIRMSLSNVASSAIFGGLLAVLVLFVFLRNLRSTFVVAAAMPVSIVITFAFMYYANITLNMMSLGGLTLGIGMLVDNSIVVLESIFRKMEEGEERTHAAIEGAREVAVSVIASTLTTIAVFLPISFAGGLSAQVFNQLSLTITFSLVSSLLVSLTFVPMACSLLLRQKDIVQDNKSKPQNLLSSFFQMVGNSLLGLEKSYQKALNGVLKHRKKTVAMTVLFIVVTGFSLSFVGFEFMPKSDESLVTVSIQMPKGTRLEETQKTTDIVVERILGMSEIAPYLQDMHVDVGGGSGRFGGSSSDKASVRVALVKKAKRPFSSDQAADLIAKQVKTIPGAQISSKATASSLSNMSGTGLQINLTGTDLDVLSQIASDVENMLKEVEGAREVENSSLGASPQATIRLKRDKAAAYGIASSSVSGVLNTAVSGNIVTTYKINGTEFDIRLRQNKENLNYLTDIQSILIPSATGANIPLYEIADITIEPMPSTITRENQERYIAITCEVFGRSISEIAKDFELAMKDYPMPNGYSWAYGGAMTQMTETFSGLGFALIVSFFLVYMIMAAEFESLVYPMIVLFSIPIALTGGLFGLVVLGLDFSITSFLGMIMLVGVVINNAIVLIDYTNLLIRERNFTTEEALKKAGPVRLRPILMSTLTTVIALIPMMISNGDGAEMMRGLAVVVVFGLSLSTLVTLLFVPVVYMSFSRIKKLKKETTNE